MTFESSPSILGQCQFRVSFAWYSFHRLPVSFQMSIADSEAAFEQHCNKLVGDGTLSMLLVNHGIKSLSALAFASGTPQSPPTEEQFKDFTTQVNGGVDMSFGMQAHLKRLHFEAAAIVMAVLTYLFRLCFNQCNASLHFGSSKHSCNFEKKTQTKPPNNRFVLVPLAHIDKHHVLGAFFRCWGLLHCYMFSMFFHSFMVDQFFHF